MLPLKKHATPNPRQAGFSLVEIMVGLVIGLLVSLVIMQVFSVFEGQKRSTTGNADAQTNGNIALYSLQNDVQQAGYGLPLMDIDNMPLNCTTVAPDQRRADGSAGADGIADVDHDGDAATPNINLSPFDIIDGGAVGSDQITVRYGTSSSGGTPVQVVDISLAPIIGVATNMGCKINDVVYAITGSNCNATRVTDLPIPTQITVANAAGISVAAPPVLPTFISCMGAWNAFTYAVNANNQLTRNNEVLIDNIVNLQAQYGVSASANSNRITQWVNASGATWGAAITTANRNRIKALRIAIIARNGLLEKDEVSSACSSTTAAQPTGLCAWDATSLDPAGAGWEAPTVDLSNLPDWNHYRYRVYETIIPIRNMVWSSDKL